MLAELHIKNFAVIKDMVMSFVPGLNVVSGEEGSGKSLLVDAMSLLMGARAPAGLMRSGTSSARIQAIFWLTEPTEKNVSAVLAENGIEPEANGMMLVSRDFQDGGKSIARINNRAVPLSLLRQVGRRMVDIHGQLEYLSLLDSANQLDLLDAYGNLQEMRQDLKRAVGELRTIEKELADMTVTEKEGYAELLQYQVEEIECAKLDEINEEQLQQERGVLRKAEAICSACLEAYAGLYGDERSVSVVIHKTITGLRSVSVVDDNLANYRDKLENGLAIIEEAAHELKDYAERIESSRERLEEIETKMETLSALKRKYGNTVAAILAFRDKAAAELGALQNGQARRALLEVQQVNQKNEAAKKAEALSLARRRSAEQLVRLVNEELGDVGLEWAKFDIVLERREDKDGLIISGGKGYSFTFDGIDRVEFQVATNPGEPMRSMAAIASGGETSRIVLAIKSALKIADPIPTLVFDEIDMGVGGRSADSVGRKLATLAGFHQVLCITHLPQIACFGDNHLRLVKEIEGGRASTRVETIEGQDRLKELAAMLGSERNSGVMLKGAEALLRNACKWKGGVRELVAS